ncbi:MAG: efflux RND transporter periplasmic adaptor subunit [Planctomycetia bacterium]
MTVHATTDASAGAAERPRGLRAGPGAGPDPVRLRRSLAGASILAVGVGLWWWIATHHFGGGHEEHAERPRTTNSTEQSAGSGAVVVLPADAATAGEIELASVAVRPIRDHLTVPGRLDYDARHRLDYESPVDGIVSRVFVNVRQRVSKGDSLAEVSSPDVGLARDDVRKRMDDRQIEKKGADWATDIATNVEDLLVSLAKKPALEAIERQFADRVLGSYREKILGAYSRMLFAEKVNAGTQQLGAGGVLSERIIDERRSNLEVATASFRAACEEARFLTRQDRDRALASLQQAERLLQVSRENLRTLVGSRLEADIEGTGSADAVADIEPDAGPGKFGALSTLVLRTPFDGLVEEIFMSRGERVRSGDRLFVVADTSTLWVRAQIHERQWTTVEVTEGQEVRVNVPGAADHDTTARINHVGATVEAESRSVPLVAELENDDAHYKPGMFVWVDLPQGRQRDALAVPAAAVMRHEGRAFVFVPEAAGRYRRVDIETGQDEGGFVEVKRGLQEGQQVVTRGAFLLKSELLLEKEEEAGAAG